MPTIAQTSPSATGPLHSFQALPYPLPIGAQQRLQKLSAAVTAATAKTGSENSDAAQARRVMVDYIGRFRETIGEELRRREFLPLQ